MEPRRQQVVDAQSEAASRRLRGVLREERASINRLLEQDPEFDMLRAVVGNHAERFGDVLNGHVQQVARLAWTEVVRCPMPRYLSDALEEDVRPITHAFAMRRGRAIDRLETVFHRTRLQEVYGLVEADYARHRILCAAIAHTEVGSAYSAGLVAGWFAVGVEQLDWVQTEPCPEQVCEQFTEMAPLDLRPSPAGVDLAAPLPPIHPGCTCFLAPVPLLAES